VLLLPGTFAYSFTAPWSTPYDTESQTAPCDGSITEHYEDPYTNNGTYQSFADAYSHFSIICGANDASVTTNEQLHGGYYTTDPYGCLQNKCVYDFSYSFTVTANLYWECNPDVGYASPHAQVQLFFAMWDNSNDTNVIGNTYYSPSALNLQMPSGSCSGLNGESNSVNVCAQTFIQGDDITLPPDTTYQPRVGVLSSADTGDGGAGAFTSEARVDLWSSSNSNCNNDPPNEAVLNYMNFDCVLNCSYLLGSQPAGALVPAYVNSSAQGVAGAQ